MSKMIISKFTTSGTWVCPAGITQVQVRCWGGGAGGYDADGFGFYYPASGSIERVFNLTVIPNTSYTITIGAGGAVLRSDSSNVEACPGRGSGLRFLRAVEVVVRRPLWVLL